jgi:hypothetical protein
MRLARAVGLVVAVLALVGLVVAARGPGGPAAISGLQTQISVRQTYSAAEATDEAQVVAHQTQSAAEVTTDATQASLVAAVSALETQVAQLQQPSTPTGPRPVLGTPGGGGIP